MGSDKYMLCVGWQTISRMVVAHICSGKTFALGKTGEWCRRDGDTGVILAAQRPEELPRPLAPAHGKISSPLTRNEQVGGGVAAELACLYVLQLHLRREPCHPEHKHGPSRPRCPLAQSHISRFSETLTRGWVCIDLFQGVWDRRGRRPLQLPVIKWSAVPCEFSLGAMQVIGRWLGPAP